MADRTHTERINFGKLREVIQPPNLIELQISSYLDYLQKDTPEKQRKPYGLEAVFREVFPISSYDEKITLNFATENYNKELKGYFGNRSEPFDMEELFQILKETRDRAIDEFIIAGDVRDKFANYEEYLRRLQEFMNLREEKILEINENLAEE